ncbi:MAG: phosphotransferase [Euzebya sp.]
MTAPASGTEYVALDRDSVIRVVTDNPALAAVTGDGALQALEIGDGNLNQVFVLSSLPEPHRTIVVKQALPYLRVAGEGWPLTRERMRFETESLRLYNRLVPDLAPLVYDHDHEQSWVAMECLDQHRVMRLGVIDGDLPQGIGGDLGRFMATLVYSTSEMSLTAPAKKAQSVRFSNPELCQLQEQFVYTNPFFDSPENICNPLLADDIRQVRTDGALKQAIALAKSQYMDHSQALLHGDLHTGSVMVHTGDPSSGDGDRPATVSPATVSPATVSRVIDPEFAFYGPVGYDVGTLLANLAIGALAQQVLLDHPARERSQAQLVDIMETSWRVFVHHIVRLWTPESGGDMASASFWGGDMDGFARFRDGVLVGIAGDAGRHGGCELLRRCMGIVSVADLQAIADLSVRARVERALLALARRWLLDSTPPSTAAALSAVHWLIDPVRQLLAADLDPGVLA